VTWTYDQPKQQSLKKKMPANNLEQKYAQNQTRNCIHSSCVDGGRKTVLTVNIDIGLTV